MKTATRFLLALTMLFLASFSIKASTFYWVGGTGAWSDYANHWATTSGGNTFQGGIPSLNDDVVFDANSFTGAGQTLQFDSSFYFCKSMDWTGVLFNPTFQATGGELNVNGSFILNSNMSITQLQVNFKSNAIGNTINSFGKDLGSVQFTGSGTYTLQSELLCTGDLSINTGTLIANGNNIQCNNLYMQPSSTLNSGDIVIRIYGTYFINGARQFIATGNVINSNQTNVVFDSDAGLLDGTNSTNVFDSVFFSGAGGLERVRVNYCIATEVSFAEQSTVGTGIFQKDITINTCVFDSLTAKNIYLYDNTTLNVNSITLISDCNNFGRISSGYVNSGGTATINCPSGTISVSNLRLAGIHATGGATFNASSCIDEGGNTGWNISALTTRTLYWIGGTGNWNDPAHWSLSSGGAAIACTPSSIDNVIFDANSLSVGDSVYTGNNDISVVNFTINANVPFFVMSGGSLVVSGNFDDHAIIDWKMFSLRLTSTSSNATVYSASSLSNFEVSCSGSYILLSDLTVTLFYLTTGQIDISNRHLTGYGFASYAPAVCIMSGATINVTSFDMRGTNTGSAQASLIFGGNAAHMLSGGTFNSVEFTTDGIIDSNVTAQNLITQGKIDIGNNNSFHIMNIQGDLFIHGDNSVDSLILINTGHEFIQDAGKTLTVGNAIVNNGQCDQFITISSSSSAQQTNIVFTGGGANLSYVDVSSINVTGGSFIAANSTDGGNNTGCTITSSPSRTLYWVGGSGQWTDSNHWSLTSGGAGGNCIPTSNDDVFFDASSNVAGATLTIDASNVSTRSLDFRGAGSDVQISGNKLSVYGDLYLEPGMILSLTKVELKPAVTSLINTAENILPELSFNGLGTVNLTDEVQSTTFDLLSGTVNLNANHIKASGISSNVGTTFNAGNVLITTTNFDLKGTVSNTATTDVELTYFAPGFFSYGNSFKTPGRFRNVTVYLNTNINASPFSCKQLTGYGYVSLNSIATTDSIEKATFYTDAGIANNCYFDTLFCNNPGNTVTMQGQVIVGSSFVCNGNAGYPVFLKSNNFLNLYKYGTDVCLKNTLLQNVVAAGPANFYAGQGCTDLGGNTNWQFTSCNNISDVWPGDANYDLLCNNADILNIGVAYNEVGPVRVGGNNSWTAQAATDFNNYFATSVNMKHADCDGNGVVDISDTIAVGQNYSLTHPARLQQPNVTTNAVLPLLELIATPDTVGPLSPVSIEALLGSNALPVDSMYGISFTINYDPTVIDTNSVSANFAGSWLGTEGVDMITFVKHFPTIGKIDVAMVRNDHVNIFNGSGHLAVFDVVIVDNISTVTSSLFHLTDVTAITYTQFVQSLARMNDSVVVDPLYDGVQHVDLSSHFMIYPNPATSELYVHANDVKVDKAEIYDMEGRLLITKKIVNNQIQMNVDALSTGMYHLRCYSDKGIYNSRIQIVNR